MCEFFSCILLPDGSLNFCEKDSHSVILDRLGIPDQNQHGKLFLRIECQPPVFEVFVDDHLPTWFEDHRNEYGEKIVKLAKRVFAVKQAWNNIFDNLWTNYYETIDFMRDMKSYYNESGHLNNAYWEAKYKLDCDREEEIENLKADKIFMYAEIPGYVAYEGIDY